MAMSEDDQLVNGWPEPKTPEMGSLALTEYTANPSPPLKDNPARVRSLVPDNFLLPNGFPDVRVSPVICPLTFLIVITLCSTYD